MFVKWVVVTGETASSGHTRGPTRNPRARVSCGGLRGDNSGGTSGPGPRFPWHVESDNAMQSVPSQPELIHRNGHGPHKQGTRRSLLPFSDVRLGLGDHTGVAHARDDPCRARHLRNGPTRRSPEHPRRTCTRSSSITAPASPRTTIQRSRTSRCAATARVPDL